MIFVRSNILIILQLLFLTLVLSSCSKFTIAKPDNISFGGVTLYPNKTFDLIYAEYDVSGAILTFGEYYYHGDTLMLEINKDVYLDKLTKPIPTPCETNGIRLNLKEYISPYEESLMSMYWYYLTVKGVTQDLDTITLWKTNSIGSQENEKLIQLKGTKIKDLKNIWAELYKTPTTSPIELPSSYNCLDITIPLIKPSQIWNKKIMSRFDEFIILESKRNYKVTAIQRQRTYKIKKASNNR